MDKYKVFVSRYGGEFWYLNSQLHRKDGPAVLHTNGDNGWYFNGKLHREDGPAVISYRNHAWYVHGEFIRRSVGG